MEQAHKRWSHTWWGILLIVFGIYIVIRFFMVFVFVPVAASPNPWTVTITGTSYNAWEGGCETTAGANTDNPNMTITAPWSAHYGAQVSSVNCYFQNQNASGSATITIRYNGQVVGSDQTNGAYAILSTIGYAP